MRRLQYKMRKRQNQEGISIIEIMVALALSGVIIAAIIQVFLSNRQAFNLSESLSRIQENGRFGVDIIGDMLRQSGNYGCFSVTSDAQQNVVDHTNLLSDVSAIQHRTTITNFFATSNGEVNDDDELDDSDSITLVIPTDNVAEVDWNAAALGTATGNTIPLLAGGNFQADMIVMLSNCQLADITVLQNTTTNTSLVPQANAFQTEIYTRRDLPSTAREVEIINLSIDEDTDELIARELAFRNGTEVVDELTLLSGIENMQFEFGVDTNAQPDFVVDYFDSIENIAPSDVNSIIAVRVSLLAISGTDEAQAITTEPQVLNFNRKTDLVMADRRLRKVFETTISLRNRMD